MCCINGIIGDIKDKEHLLAAMNKSTCHRGPDFSGKFISKSTEAALGHNLLTIRGNAKSTRQPISFKDVAVILNGEIYNYAKLRKKYESKYRFFSKSDAEILIYLYLDKGKACVNELEGEFSLAIWDEPSKKLILATDPIGIKQLYYALSDSGLIFSSEIRAILSTGLVKKEFNPDVLFHAITTGCPFGNDTAYKGIHKLEAGTTMVFERGKRRIEKYFRLATLSKIAPIKRLNKADKLISVFDKAIESSVRQRSIGECKIGISLSGGVDSSLIASHLMDNRPDAKAIFLRLTDLEESEDETEYKTTAVKKLGIASSEIGTKIHSRKEFVRAVLEISEDLVFNPVIFSEYLIFLHAHQLGIKAMLTGDGADELFLGYEFFNSLLEIVKSKDPLAGFLKYEDTYLTLEEMGGIFNTYLKENTYFYSNHFYFDDTLKGYLLCERYRKRFGQSTEHLISESLREFDSADSLTRFTAGELIFKLPQTLSILDRYSSHFGVEARVPYLNKEIIRLALSTKQEQKTTEELTKITLRKLAEKRLGKEIAYRKKIGLDFPINTLVKNKKRLYEAILKSTLAGSGIFNLNYLKFRQKLDLDSPQMSHLDAYLLFIFLWYDYHFAKGKLLELLD
jgi:asparagine synthase (glutamine-hydrolysing)